MINVDISNIWGSVSLPDLLALEAEVSRAHMALTPAPDWLRLPPSDGTDELALILDAGQRIRQMSDAVVIVGDCPAARAAISLLQGPNRNIGKAKGDPAVYFAGTALSSRQLQDLTHQLEGKDYSLIVLPSQEGALAAPLVLRSLRWMLERKYGTLEARSRVFAVTAPWDPTLEALADTHEWEVFPLEIAPPYLAFSAAGLLPMAAAGLDVKALVEGCEKAKEEMDLRSFENPVWLYAAARCLMGKAGKTAELLTGWEPGLEAFGLWWQQLFAQGDPQGLFPSAASLPAPWLESQLAHSGHRLLETVFRFAPGPNTPAIAPDALDTDGLNYLAGRTLDDVAADDLALLTEAHTDRGVSIVTADCGCLCEQTLGEVFLFCQLSCAICGLVSAATEALQG